MDFKKIFIVFILLGLAVTLLGIDSADAKHSITALTILSPNGGEKWEVGKTYEISWKAKGLKKVSIGLWASDKLPVRGRSSSSFAINSGSLDAQQGSYKWTINPKEIELDISKYKYYKIAIDGYTRIPKGFPSRSAVRDVSDRYFSIVESPTQPSITVLSPNGGEWWNLDTTYTITWKHNLAGNFEAWIDLLKGGTYYGSIAGGDVRLLNAQNLTSYSWRVGDMKGGVGAGNDYQVRITYNDGNTGKTLTDISDNYFGITSGSTSTPSITVLSPNGGEVLIAGKTYPINWKSVGIGTVKFSVCSDTPLLTVEYSCWDLAGRAGVGIVALHQTLDWEIDPNAPYIPGKVRVRITDVVSGIYDESDNFFSVVAPITAL